ncbi:helix-turn-helix domain-containing protein [Paraburkholderia sediminicola]|uniref:helix-turn-helix domain-containing protein n=1 Tax=Paraburkholderia sediminicola TaxID=458836 RepID=UPI0038BC2C3F
MAPKTAPLLRSTELRLQQLGERLRLGRRRLTGKRVAERAGMTPVTLRSLEKGSSGVTIGAYLAVMQVLGADKDLAPAEGRPSWPKPAGCSTAKAVARYKANCTPGAKASGLYVCSLRKNRALRREQLDSR